MLVKASARRRVLHPRRATGDVAIALALGALATVMDVVGPDQRGAEAIYWNLALAAPLVVRRANPEVAAALLGLVCLAQWRWGPPVMGDIAVLVMLYTLGARATGPGLSRTRVDLAVAVLVAQLGVLLAVTRWQPGDLLSPLALTGTVTASWGAGIYVRTRRAWITSLQERAETAEREQAHQSQIAVAAERARIARELHDVVAHSLSVMITLNDAAAAVGPRGQVRDTVEQASEVGRQALGEMHRLLGVLREEQDDATPGATAELRPQPSTEQLKDLVALVRSAGPQVELRTTGALSTLPPSIQLAAYRIVQESLTNVLKHGHNVTRVVVAVSRRLDCLEILVDDDGQSDPHLSRRSHQQHSSGLGLIGMRERALVFGGTVEAGTRAGGGWRVTTALQLADRGTTRAPTTSSASTAP